MQDNLTKWQRAYQKPSAMPAPTQVLVDNAHLLPATGQTLDLACGLAANAVFMANRGLQACAWDQSAAAIEQVRDYADRHQLDIQTAVRDVVAKPPTAASFDVIVVSRFLDRGLCPAIAAALKPGGLLFYQTFSAHKISDSGPSHPDYLLGDNELLDLFAGLHVRVYREEMQLGDLADGYRDQVMLVAEKCT